MTKLVRSPGAVPLYRQIVEDFRSQIIEGTLGPGSRLATVRELTESLGVARLTVLRAFRELKQAGLIESHSGAGTIVSGRLDRRSTVKTLQRLNSRGFMPHQEKVAHDAQLYSMCTALADPSLVRMDEIGFAFSGLGALDPWDCYLSPPGGNPELLHGGAKLLRNLIPHIDEGQLNVTHGTTSGLALAIAVTGTRTNKVAFLTPMLSVIPRVAAAAGLTSHGIPEQLLFDDPKQFEEVLARIDPDSIVVSSIGNPVHGISMPDSAKEQLLEICARRNIAIIDYLIHGFFKQPSALPIGALESENIFTNVGLDTHFTAGLSVGFLVAPPELAQTICLRLFATSMGVSTILQQGCAKLLNEGSIDAHIRRVTPIYQDRCKALVHALKMRLAPLGCTWRKPDSGLSLMVTLPPGITSDALFPKAIARGVMVLPGAEFENDNPQSCIRLSYGMQSEESLDGAIRALAGAISAELAAQD